jgi:integrase/recombinase XerD
LNLIAFGTAITTRLNAKGVGMRTIQKLMGHRNLGTTALCCDVSDEALRNAVELV